MFDWEEFLLKKVKEKGVLKIIKEYKNELPEILEIQKKIDRLENNIKMGVYYLVREEIATYNIFKIQLEELKEQKYKLLSSYSPP